MPISIEQAVDEPIITVSFVGALDPENIREVNEKLAKMFGESGVVYTILDVRESEITFGEVVTLLDNPDSFPLTSDPRIKYVFVGQSVPHDPTNQMNAPVFSGKEQAVEYIRKEIATNALG